MNNLPPCGFNNMHAALPHPGNGGELANGAGVPASFLSAQARLWVSPPIARVCKNHLSRYLPDCLE